MNNEAKIKLVAKRSEAEALAFSEIEAKIIALQVSTVIYREKKVRQNDEVVREKSSS